MFKHSKILVLSALALLTLASCGGDNGSASSASSSSDSSSETSSSEEITKYAITVANDNVVLDGLPSEAAAGEQITFSVAVRPGYEFSGQITATSGNAVVEVTKQGELFSFVMPEGAVEVVPETDVSSFEIETIVDTDDDNVQHLTVTAYERVLETDVAEADYIELAGTYTGTLGYAYSSSSTYTMDTTFTIDCFGNWGISGISSRGSYYNVSANGTYGEGITIAQGETSKTLTLYTSNSLNCTFTIAVDSETGNVSLTPTQAVIGSYNYSIGTLEMTEKGAGPEEGAYLPIELDGIPEAWEYQGFFYIEVIADNYQTLDTVSVNGTAIEAETDGVFAGLFKIDVPYHKTTINVSAQTRYAGITIDSQPGFEVKAYSRSEQTVTDAETGESSIQAVYTEITEAEYQQTVYFKVTPNDGYALSWVDLEYNSTSSVLSSTSSSSSLALNEDGYWYNANGLSAMSDMDFGMIFHVYGGATDSAARTGYYVNPGDDYCSTISGFGGNEELGAKGSNLIRIFSGTWACYDFVEEGATSGELNVYKNSSRETYKGWFDGEDLYVLDINDSGFGGSYIVLKSSVRPTVTTKYNGTSVNNSTVVIQELSWTTGTGDEAVTHSKRVVIEAEDGSMTNVDFNAQLDYKVGTDTETVGNVFALTTSDGRDLGLFKVTGTETMAETISLTPGTYTNAELLGVDLIVAEDGFSISYGTVGSEVSAYFTAVESAGEGLASVAFVIADTTDVKLYTVTLDLVNNTFEAVDGKPFDVSLLGQFNGASVSYGASAPSLSQSYKMCISNGVSTPLVGTWESSSNYTTSITAQGEISVGSYVIELSADGQSAITHSGSNTYVLSKSITTYSSSARSVTYAKYGNGYLAELIPSSDSYGTRNYDVFYLDFTTSATWVNLVAADGVDWSEDGAHFTIVDGDTTSYLINNAGTIANDIVGTFTVSEGVTITFADGVVTYGDISTSFTVVDATTAQFTVESEGTVTIYTATLDFTAMTASVTSQSYTVSSITPTIDLGSTNAWTYDSEADTYTSASGFRSSSSTITFTYAESTWDLSFNYSIGSESNYDYMFIQVNGEYYSGWSDSEKSAHSGADVTGSVSITGLAAGDIVTVGYYKDSYGDRNGDKVVLSNLSATSYVPVTTGE